MNPTPNRPGIVPPEVTGGPYPYLCLACHHRFMRTFLPLGLFCPACKSLRVVRDPTLQY